MNFNKFLLASFIFLSACGGERLQPEKNPQVLGPAEHDSKISSQQVNVKKLDTLTAPKHYEKNIAQLCQELGNKLGSISVSDCNTVKMQNSGIFSVQNRSVGIKEFTPENNNSLGKVLVIGGIHGDEYASISIAFKWMQQLEQERDGRLHWRFIPLANPDGLLRKKSQRQNANGVDLNRNFPSQDWDRLALNYWRNKTYNNPRRFPGNESASEPETIGLIKQIEEFKPDIIVSIHAPYHLLDYDGPSTAPQSIGDLHLHELGVYPGSLGNYGGLDLQLPVVTLELPSAGIMPKPNEIAHMWQDLNKWLINERLQTVKTARVHER